MGSKTRKAAGRDSACGVTVRWYVDADTLGLAHALVRLRSDVTFPGDPGGKVHKKARPACLITQTATPDETWIPIVAEQGWAIITRDTRILRRPAELQLVKQHKARMFTISSTEKLTNWHMLEVLMCNWRAIEARVDKSGPFVWTMTRTAMKPASLESSTYSEPRVKERRELKAAPAPRQAKLPGV
jgi:hypothetical protein